ncbi:MAG: hypothetical protein JST90_16760 [Bacteroidetes bacterium]|nr:hypothetical protein [Bacteroidota bacterium]
MNLNNVFSRSLMSSLGGGFLVFFIGVSAVFFITCLRDEGNILEAGSLIFFIAFAMYVVYWPIQIALSIIHLITARMWGQRSKYPTSSVIIQSFLIGEWLLYMAIYLFLAWAFYGPEVWIGVFLFSIPYIICCSISVYYFHRYLTQAIIEEQEASTIPAENSIES